MHRLRGSCTTVYITQGLPLWLWPCCIVKTIVLHGPTFPKWAIPLSTLAFGHDLSSWLVSPTSVPLWTHSPPTSSSASQFCKPPANVNVTNHYRRRQLEIELGGQWQEWGQDDTSTSGKKKVQVSPSASISRKLTDFVLAESSDPKYQILAELIAEVSSPISFHWPHMTDCYLVGCIPDWLDLFLHGKFRNSSLTNLSV